MWTDLFIENPTAAPATVSLLHHDRTSLRNVTREGWTFDDSADDDAQYARELTRRVIALHKPNQRRSTLSMSSLVPEIKIDSAGMLLGDERYSLHRGAVSEVIIAPDGVYSLATVTLDEAPHTLLRVQAQLPTLDEQSDLCGDGIHSLECLQLSEEYKSAYDQFTATKRVPHYTEVLMTGRDRLQYPMTPLSYGVSRRYISDEKLYSQVQWFMEDLHVSARSTRLPPVNRMFLSPDRSERE
jgi:hypothetical protein